jgi:hypothetical protein
MKRSIAVASLALMVFCGLALPTSAGSLSGTFDGTTTLTPTGSPGIFTSSFTGDGDDVTYGPFTPSATSTIDLSDLPNIAPAGTMFLLTFSDGTLFGPASGHGNGNGQGMGTFTADLVITGGTGIFAGARGEATLMGTITRTSTTTVSVSDGSYVGTFTIPEPSTFTLLAPAVSVGAVIVVRRRRREAMAR